MSRHQLCTSISLEHQKMHYQLDKDTVLQLLRDHPMFAEYTAAQLTLDLDLLLQGDFLILQVVSICGHSRFGHLARQISGVRMT